MAKEIQLTRGHVTLVDDDMYDELSRYRWQAVKRKNTWYVQGGSLSPNGRGSKTRTLQKTVYMHRVIMGVTDPKIFVDHIDHNALNNQRSNLRICNRSENAKNMGVAWGASSYKGVHKGSVNRWRAMIWVNGKNKLIGSFISERDAAIAYNNAAIEHFGEFASLNTVK